MSTAELAAARAERAARFAAAQASAAAAAPPPPPPPPPPLAQPAALRADDDADDAAVEPPARRQRVRENTAENTANTDDADCAADVLACIELSGERDRQGTHKATEVDCRLWESAWRPVSAGSRVYTLNSGEGRLHDTRANTEAERQRNVRFLTESARLFHQARGRGEAVWVHCTEVRHSAQRAALRRLANTRRAPFLSLSHA
jgi:hypothetical protein